MLFLAVQDQREPNTMINVLILGEGLECKVKSELAIIKECCCDLQMKNTVISIDQDY